MIPFPKLKTKFTERLRISEERLMVCRKCEKFNHANRKCQECGCYMDVKTLLPWVSCPLSKWGEYGDADQKEQNDMFREIEEYNLDKPDD